jgi:uncharacterized protein YcbX
MTSTPVGRVSQLWRFPVKSMQGEQIAEGELTPKGFVGDRQYAARDPEDGRVLTGKRYGRLLMASARTEAAGSVIVVLPGAGEHAADDPGIHDVLSSWLDHPCRLERPPDDAAPFSMSFDVDHPDENTFDWPCPPGTFLDLAGAHLLTTASLRAAAALHPDGRWDVRRFRPTALVDAGDATDFVEDNWIGSQVRLGGATLTIDMPTVRCPMPTREQPDGLVRDLAIAHTLRDHHDNNLGVYATVTASGRVAVGDEVALVTDG